MDLPVDDITAGLDHYADAVLAAMAGIEGDDVVLVGHSMGGQVISRVALHRRVARLVFVCSLPAPAAANERAGLVPTAADLDRWWSRDDRDRLVMSRQAAVELYFRDCDGDVARWAVDHLRPQTAPALLADDVVAEAPGVPMHAVFSTEDLLSSPRVRELAAQRCGEPPTLIPGGHSPFLARPKELAHVLDRLAARHS